MSHARRYGIGYAQKLVKFGLAVFELCERQTDKHRPTDRQTDIYLRTRVIAQASM